MELKKGDAFVVGFGSYSISGVSLEDVKKEAIGDLLVVKGEDNEPKAMYGSGAGTRYSGSGLCESNVSSQAIGDEITFNGESVIVEKWTVGHSREIAKVEFQLVAYDSLA